jgi:hypothetical protein
MTGAGATVGCSVTGAGAGVSDATGAGSTDVVSGTGAAVGSSVAGSGVGATVTAGSSTTSLVAGSTTGSVGVAAGSGVGAGAASVLPPPPSRGPTKGNSGKFNSWAAAGAASSQSMRMASIVKESNN